MFIFSLFLQGGSSCPQPVNASQSSVYNPVENCLDNDSLTFCSTSPERNPWFVLRYDTPVNVSEGVLTKVFEVGDYLVYLTDTMPVKGEVVATGNRILLL